MRLPEASMRISPSRRISKMSPRSCGSSYPLEAADCLHEPRALKSQSAKGPERYLSPSESANDRFDEASRFDLVYAIVVAVCPHHERRRKAARPARSGGRGQ